MNDFSGKSFQKENRSGNSFNMILKRTLKGDSTYRKYLSPPVANPTYRLPSICSQRNTNDPAETEIKTVDSYRLVFLLYKCNKLFIILSSLDAIIGEGTFGQVFRGQCLETEAIVALKKVRLDRERDGFPITAIREIKLLMRLSHVNIVKLHCVVQAKDLSSFFLVFEYVDNDLTGIIENRMLQSKQIKVSFSIISP